jgi:hypothetical protein
VLNIYKFLSAARFIVKPKPSRQTGNECLASNKDEIKTAHLGSGCSVDRLPFVSRPNLPAALSANATRRAGKIFQWQTGLF